MSSISFLKTLYDPKRYTGGIPCNSPVSLARKDITVYGVLKPGTDVDSTGMIIWNVNRGCYSVVLAGLPETITFPFGGISTMIQVATYAILNPWPIPYKSSQDMLSLKPDLTGTMDLGRPVAGLITMYSATTSTTLAALNGELAGSTVSDLRNCGDFSVPAIIQAGSTIKDAICNVRPNKGISSIIGCDVPADVAMINFDDGIACGPTALISGTGAMTTLDILAEGTACFAVYDPLGLNMTLSLAVPGYVTFGVKEVLPPGVHVSCRTAITFTNANIGVFQVVAEVYYATVMAGQPARCTVETLIMGTLTTEKTKPGQTTIFESAISLNRFDKQIVAICFGLCAVSPTVGSPYPNFTFKTSVLAHDAYGPSGFGAFRILRWDNVDSTQTINVKGTIMTEAVPSGAIAPFVKGSPSAGATTTPHHVLSALRSLFNNPATAARRVFVASDATDCCTTTEDSAFGTALASGMYASGMYAGGFSDVGKMIGNALGDVAGTGLSLIGNTLDDVFSASGGRQMKKRRLDF